MDQWCCLLFVVVGKNVCDSVRMRAYVCASACIGVSGLACV
jgi:hypothetical protein